MKAFDNTTTNDYGDLNQIMGSVHMAGFNMKIAGQDQREGIAGWGLTGTNAIDIFAGFEGQGVVIDVDLLIDSIEIAAMSWGDADGISGMVDGADESQVVVYGNGMLGTGAGYVGATNFAIDDLLIKGRVTIDVATVTVDETAGLANAQVPGLFGIWAAGAGNNASSTYVHLGFDQMNIRMLEMTMDIALGNTTELTGGTLGSVYVANMDRGDKHYRFIAQVCQLVGF